MPICKGLLFVHIHSVHPDKDSLYLKALQQLEQQYEGKPAVAQVAYLVVQQQIGIAQQVRPRAAVPASAALNKPRRNLPFLSGKLKQIVSLYPGTEGAANAFNLLQSLKRPVLEVKTEEVNLPEQNIKALLSYQNVDKVYLKVYRVENEPQDNNTGRGTVEKTTAA